MRDVDGLIEVGVDSGAVDLVVSAYRGNPDLLEALLSSPVTKERTMYIAARAGDEVLLQAVGWEAASRLDPVEALSRREREVYELLCDGFSNSDIAKRLFITEGTVKVHVQHVFDKLGVRSRTAVASTPPVTAADMPASRRSISPRQAAPNTLSTEGTSAGPSVRAPSSSPASAE